LGRRDENVEIRRVLAGRSTFSSLFDENVETRGESARRSTFSA
jgi:hypothetical protein